MTPMVMKDFFMDTDFWAIVRRIVSYNDAVDENEKPDELSAMA
jgi:hypothetical protein